MGCLVPSTIERLALSCDEACDELDGGGPRMCMFWNCWASCGEMVGEVTDGLGEPRLGRWLSEPFAMPCGIAGRPPAIIGLFCSAGERGLKEEGDFCCGGEVFHDWGGRWDEAAEFCEEKEERDCAGAWPMCIGGLGSAWCCGGRAMACCCACSR